MVSPADTGQGNPPVLNSLKAQTLVSPLRSPFSHYPARTELPQRIDAGVAVTRCSCPRPVGAAVIPEGNRDPMDRPLATWLPARGNLQGDAKPATDSIQPGCALQYPHVFRLSITMPFGPFVPYLQRATRFTQPHGRLILRKSRCSHRPPCLRASRISLLIGALRSLRSRRSSGVSRL